MMNVSVQMVSNLERGNKSIRIENLINLCHILNISTDYILLGKETLNDIDSLAVSMKSLSEKERKMIEMIINYCLTEN